jgi:hypothetical protein
MEAPLDPARYRRSYETALGAEVDADEKEVAFALLGLAPGERVLDLGRADGRRTAPAPERAGSAVWLDRAPGEHARRAHLAIL